MSGIFISYRRDDSQGFAGRLADDLTEILGDPAVFRDTEIEPGDDFTEVLGSSIQNASVVLVVIGPRWLNAVDAQGRKRLEIPNDWVRREIEWSLDRGIHVVPVLVGGASMPSPERLPESLAPLSRFQAFPLSDLRWSEELPQLADRLAELDLALRDARKAEAARALESGPRSGIRGLRSEVMHEVLRGARSGAGSRPPPSLGARFRWWVMRGVSRAVILGVLLAAGYFLVQEFGTPRMQAGLAGTLNAVSALVKELVARLAAGA